MRIRTTRDIGILIREARRRRGLSQVALAKMINSTLTWVSWIENGKSIAEIGIVLLSLVTLGVELNFDLPSSTSIMPTDDDSQRVDEDIPPYTL